MNDSHPLHKDTLIIPSSQCSKVQVCKTSSSRYEYNVIMINEHVLKLINTNTICWPTILNKYGQIAVLRQSHLCHKLANTAFNTLDG